MSHFGDGLPQLESRLFLTDGGLETTLIFHDGLDLPYFAAFTLLKSDKGRRTLADYYERYLAIAERDGLGFILESPTWRASRDWGEKLGLTADDIAAVNRAAIGLMEELRDNRQSTENAIVISGCIGPRGDGYDPGAVMSAAEAQDYHAHQARAFAEAGADMIAAVTMTNTNEAIGVARAAEAVGLPCAISFTVETDGRLPTGETLEAAINAVDAETDSYPAYYMINCAHPTHFANSLAAGAPWMRRVRGLRANASRRSHQELNDSPDLDDGDPQELGQEYRDLLARHPQISILGGCCGTDHRHVDSISRACCSAG